MGHYGYLVHYGIDGQKWHRRRFQNEDGTLTPAGRERYGVGPARSDKKVSTPKLMAYEARYRVKSAVSKAGESLKGDARQIAKNVKEVTKDRYTEPSRTLRRESAARARERQRQARIEEKSQKLEQKKERLAQKLVDKQNRKTIADLKKALDDASLNGARREVERLAAKRDRAKEKALLKEESKQLKKELKNAKKDAEKEAKEKFSRNKIKSLTDEEIEARIARLQKEATLVKLEASRNVPAGAKLVGDAIVNAGADAARSIARDGFTFAGKKLLEYMGLSEVVKESAADRVSALRNQLEEKKLRKELEEYGKETSASRTKKMREELDEKRVRDELAEYGKETSASRTKKMREELDEMRVRDELATYGKDPLKNLYSGEATKARLEMERRVRAYTNSGLTIEEIADRMNVSESLVKDLKYTMVKDLKYTMHK